MSNPESFIEEVTEEVRRDRLFATVSQIWLDRSVAGRRHRGRCCLYRMAKIQRSGPQAQAFGDAVVAAMDAETPEARRAALAAVSGTRATAMPFCSFCWPVTRPKTAQRRLAALETVIARRTAFRSPTAIWRPCAM